MLSTQLSSTFKWQRYNPYICSFFCPPSPLCILKNVSSIMMLFYMSYILSYYEVFSRHVSVILMLFYMTCLNYHDVSACQDVHSGVDLVWSVLATLPYIFYILLLPPGNTIDRYLTSYPCDPIFLIPYVCFS